jgi:hypothetical protein
MGLLSAAEYLHTQLAMDSVYMFCLLMHFFELQIVPEIAVVAEIL